MLTNGQQLKISLIHIIPENALEGGKLLPMKQMAWKVLVNLLVGLQLFHCIYTNWLEKLINESCVVC